MEKQKLINLLLTALAFWITLFYMAFYNLI